MSAKTVYIFDLDFTLYPLKHPLGVELYTFVDKWIGDKIGKTVDETHALIRAHIEAGEEPFGTIAEAYGFDVRDILIYPEHLNYDTLQPCPETRELLQALPAAARIVYTDGIAKHAELALAKLELKDVFDTVYDLEFSNFTGKAVQGDFQHVLDDMSLKLGRPVAASDCVMVEDSYLNLKVAKAMGMRTVLLSEKPKEDASWKEPAWVDECETDLLLWLRKEVMRQTILSR